MRPENNRSFVAIAANFLAQLLLRLLEHRGVFKMLGPVDGDFRPDQDAHAVGRASHPLVMRIVDEAHIVAAQFARPSK